MAGRKHTTMLAGLILNLWPQTSSELLGILGNSTLFKPPKPLSSSSLSDDQLAFRFLFHVSDFPVNWISIKKAVISLIPYSQCCAPHDSRVLGKPCLNSVYQLVFFPFFFSSHSNKESDIAKSMSPPPSFRNKILQIQRVLLSLSWSHHPLSYPLNQRLLMCPRKPSHADPLLQEAWLKMVPDVSSEFVTVLSPTGCSQQWQGFGSGPFLSDAELLY